MCTLTVESSVGNPLIHSVHPLIHYWLKTLCSSCINRLSEPCWLLKHLLHNTEDMSLILLHVSSVVWGSMYFWTSSPSSYPLLDCAGFYLFPFCFLVFSLALYVLCVLSVTPVCAGWAWLIQDLSHSHTMPALVIHLHLIGSSDCPAFNSGSLMHTLPVCRRSLRW